MDAGLDRSTLVIAAPILGGLAALVCALGIRALHPLLVRYALARPNARSSHATPTPQGAGLALVGAVVGLGLIAVAVLGLPAQPLVVLFAAALLLAAVGAVDDIRPLPALPRLAGQILAVGAVVGMLPAEARIVPELPALVERALLVLAGVWFVNLTNFMDGLDWMTVSQFVPLTAAIVLFGVLAGTVDAATTLVAALLCGALIGFAPFNRPVAAVFLGDVGSLPIGLFAGWCLLQLAASGALAAAILLPLYYLADATLTLFLRLSRGERVWEAHRSHFYQRATANDLSVSAITNVVFALNVVLAVLAALTLAVPVPPFQAGLVGVGALAVASVLRLFATGLPK
ncbi:glycosyl transferase [Blastochloris sulfoviridis]|uniref:Glycosyl transferase n=1 Tax=Blastochloris sulfoviridis TaxID=50712 RepID=A0A5M6HMZ2_9HYPH|nr:glycosyl transferase [Blastochloris sulfoviridis]KAA5597212.1 glycosyl transferase [Blastochloris sulfoviridis]